jgi:4-hydroxyacetophenone monooxygenase
MRLERAALKAALPHADLRVLLMVLFHYTDDEKWLAPPYAPRRNPRLIADEDAGLPDDIQNDIRSAALDILSGDMAAKLPDPDEATFSRMMVHSLAEDVPPEYAPMMREQMGFTPLGSTIEQPTQKPEQPIVIIGAGVAGLALGKLLNDLNLPYVILEKNQNVGGTWWENTYPGAGVDTPNHAYSFSFGKSYRWSRYFSPQDEIQDYLSGKADEFNIRPHIRFGVEVKQIDWQADRGHWLLQTQSASGSETLVAPILVSAVGQISVAKTPPIEGLDDFQGTLFHSSKWPQQLDLKGKKVAIVGTGASSMQIAPTIADEVAELTIFQRSPQWARPIPRYHETLSDGAQYLLEHVPFYARWFRFTMFWRYGDGLLPFLKKDPDWPHPERAMNRINDRHREEMVAHIETKLAGHADLIAKSMPDYPPYGKRILLDNHWYDTLLKDNVTLHDEGVARFSENQIIGENGNICAPDIVIMATGFEVTKMASRLNISGPAGNLSDVWDGDDPQAYLGISVPDFPNFFMMAGPTTGLGHGGSGMFIAECHAHYIANAIVTMLNHGIAQMAAKQSAQRAYMDKYNAGHQDMIWMHPGMTTYYRNSKGRVYSVMPWRLVDYWNMTRTTALEDYETGT